MSLTPSTDSSPAESAASSSDDDRYRLTHSSQIGTVLRDLSWQKCIINVRAARGVETVTTVLKVDPASRSFIFDWCRTDSESEAVQGSSENAFSASLRGVPVNFVVGNPTPVQYEGGPAFSAPFPDKVYHFQRRRHFRARTLVTRGYSCEVRLDGGKSVQLDISDLSLSGAGLRSKTVSDEVLPLGTKMARAKLDFRELGKLELDLVVVGHWLVGRDESAIHHFGCSFANVDGRVENTLQRLVFALELAHRG